MKMSLMSLSRKISIVVGAVAGMAVATVGLAFWSEKLAYMGRRRGEKRLAAIRREQHEKARDEGRN